MSSGTTTTTTTVGKGLLFLSSPLQVELEEETYKVINENQGIISILRSESTMATAISLRRNLSADMSSRQWLAQNEFSSAMKKIASSEQLAEISTATLKEEASRSGQDDVWMSIQHMTKREAEKPDSWSSILSPNAKDQDQPNNNLPPPYVHPLVKRSSSLSEKSLQICTESLGSETGSEGFSSYPPSDHTASDNEENKEELIQQHKQTSQMEKQPEDQWKTTKCMYSTRTKSTLRSFPPPLPSLSQSAGLTLHMQSHRSHGRLVLEAVSIPSQNFFHAERQDGRLVLKLNASQNLSDQDIVDQEQEDDDHIDEQVSEDFEDEDGDGDGDGDGEREEELEDESWGEEVEEIVRQETEVKEVTVLIEQEPRLLSNGGSMNVHRSSIMFKNIMRIDNLNQAWPNRFNREVNLARVEMEMKLEEEVASNSLPPVTRLIRSPSVTTTIGTTGSFNAYDYFWRTKPTNNQQSPNEKKNNILTILPPNGPKACKRQELVFLRGNKGAYLLPLVTGCKDSRRSLLIWDPYCVATS